MSQKAILRGKFRRQLRQTFQSNLLLTQPAKYAFVEREDPQLKIYRVGISKRRQLAFKNMQLPDVLVVPSYPTTITDKVVNQERTVSEAAAAIETGRLHKHRRAIDLLFGMWKDREGGPPDGVEYQEEMRAAW